MVERLNEQNNFFIETTQKQQMKLQWSTEKNLVVIAKLGRGPNESWCGSGRIKYASEGNESVKAKGRVRKPLPLLNGGVRQLEDETCIYES
jgi:hypothetical protein